MFSYYFHLIQKRLREYIVRHSRRTSISLSVFVLFLELALLIITAVYVCSYPYVGASWRWSNREVTQVDAGTPAFWVGLQPSTRLMEIDQQLVIKGADKLYQKRVGDTVVLTWLDGHIERTAQLKVIPTPPLILFWRLEPLLIACAFWLIGATVLALRPSADSARFFFLICLVSVGIICIGLLSTLGVLLSSPLFNALLCLLAPLLVHFHQIFLHDGGLRWRRLFYGAALAISWPHLVWSRVTLRLFGIYSPLRTAGRILIVISLLLSLFLLIRTYIYASTILMRQRIRLLLFGSSFGFLPLIFFSLLPNIVDVRSWLPYEISFIALLLIPTAYLWAIWKHNLFETDRILNRTVVYTIIVFFFLSLYLLGVILLSPFLSDSESPELVLVILLILFMALFQSPLLRWTQLVVERVFYKGRVDTYSLAKQLSSKLATTLSRSQFLQLLTEELPDILSSRGAAIFLPTNEEGILQLWRSTGFSVPEWAPLERSGQLITLLSRQPTLSHSQLLKLVVELSLTEEESLLLASDEIALWLPICFNDELEALLILGPKRADEFYTHKEFEVLHLLARQAATTLKNIELFQTLESQLFELKIKQEALKKAHQSELVAREEERKALARELHDRPIQEIIGISMDLWTFSEDAQSESLRSDLQTLRSETLNCLKGLRSTCTNLRPPDLECSGLASAIRTYIEKRADLSNLYELDLMNDAGRLPEQVAISLFRIFQEATQNSLKHANAQKILVQLSLDETSCTLTISDDGDGFSLPAPLPDLANNEHFGLLGMQERAELIGANLKITSKLGHGTIVFVYVPLPKLRAKELKNENENENEKNSRRHS